MKELGKSGTMSGVETFLQVGMDRLCKRTGEKFWKDGLRNRRPRNIFTVKILPREERDELKEED